MWISFGLSLTLCVIPIFLQNFYFSKNKFDFVLVLSSFTMHVISNFCPFRSISNSFWDKCKFMPGNFSKFSDKCYPQMLHVISSFCPFRSISVYKISANLYVHGHVTLRIMWPWSMQIFQIRNVCKFDPCDRKFSSVLPYLLQLV